MASSSIIYKVVLYYVYTDISDVDEMQKWQHNVSSKLGLTGRVLVSKEGMNGTLAAGGDNQSNIDEYIKMMMEKEERFKKIDWKFSTSKVVPFPDLSVKIVNEIVGYGKELAHIDPSNTTGNHLSPQEFHNAVEKANIENEGKENPNTIILDIRNAFEHSIGHFNGSLSPEMRVSSDFAPWVQKNLPLLQGKKILTYCTGGVRCEKASGYLLQQHGITDVSQLNGGIHRYFEAFPDGGQFKGRNFIFDARVTVAPGNYEEDKLENTGIAAVSEEGGEDPSEKRQKIETSKHFPTTSSNVVAPPKWFQTVGKCGICGDAYDQPRAHDVCTVCKAVCIICDKCRHEHAEIHCNDHKHLNKSYFWFLEVFSLKELEEQRTFLSSLLDVATKTKTKKKSDLKPRAEEDEDKNDDDANTGVGVHGLNEWSDWALNSKNRRRTLRKQITRIEAHMAQMTKGEVKEGQGLNARKCRWCEKCLEPKWQVNEQALQHAQVLSEKSRKDDSNDDDTTWSGVCDGRCWGFWKAPVNGSYHDGDGV